MVAVEDPATLLSSQGLRVTAQRVDVLRAVRECPQSTAAEVAEQVAASIGAVSRQAVCAASGTLTGKGLLPRAQPARSPALFDSRVGDDYENVVCHECGAVADVDCEVGGSTWSAVAVASGYEIQCVELLSRGTCPACLGARAGRDG